MLLSASFHGCRLTSQFYKYLLTPLGLLYYCSTSPTRDRACAACLWSLCERPESCSRKHILFYSRIPTKTRLFYVFWNDVSKKNVKSHKKYQVCWMSIEILASKLPDVMGTYRVGQKSKPDNFCNNFVYCHPIFIIFGTYTTGNLQPEDCIVSPPLDRMGNTPSVTGPDRGRSHLIRDDDNSVDSRSRSTEAS